MDWSAPPETGVAAAAPESWQAGQAETTESLVKFQGFAASVASGSEDERWTGVPCLRPQPTRCRLESQTPCQIQRRLGRLGGLGSEIASLGSFRNV